MDRNLVACRMEAFWNLQRGLPSSLHKFNIEYPSAVVAIKMKMLLHIRAITHRDPVQIYLAHQPAFHQGVEAVINRRHRNVRHPIFGSHEDLFRGRMIPSGQQHVINVLPLCREPKAPRRQSFGKPALELEVFVFHH